MKIPKQEQIPQLRSISSDLVRVLRQKGDVDGFYRSRGLDAIAEVRNRGSVLSRKGR